MTYLPKAPGGGALGHETVATARIERWLKLVVSFLLESQARVLIKES
jgi:hypothetical protein